MKVNKNLLPSVSWLVHKHQLTDADLAGIQGTGPRNRILKGDILSFLESFTTSSAIEYEQYFAIDLHTNHLNLAEILAKSVSISKELEIAKPPFYLSRHRNGSVMNTKFDENITAKILDKLSNSDEKSTLGSMKYV